MMSAPALAKASRYGSAGAIIRCTSKGFLVTRPDAPARPAGRTVMLGTKWPSITSTWIQSAPASIDGAHLLAEAGEIGGQDRGGDEDRGHWRAGSTAGRGRQPEGPVGFGLSPRREAWTPRAAARNMAASQLGASHDHHAHQRPLEPPGPRMRPGRRCGQSRLSCGPHRPGTRGQDITRPNLGRCSPPSTASSWGGRHRQIEALCKRSIWLTDMKNYNSAIGTAVWNDWVDPKNPPARACIRSEFARPDFLIEIMVTATR